MFLKSQTCLWTRDLLSTSATAQTQSAPHPGKQHLFPHAAPGRVAAPHPPPAGSGEARGGTDGHRPTQPCPQGRGGGPRRVEGSSLLPSSPHPTPKVARTTEDPSPARAGKCCGGSGPASPLGAKGSFSYQCIKLLKSSQLWTTYLSAMLC